jgi:hypothetical protein
MKLRNAGAIPGMRRHSEGQTFRCEGDRDGERTWRTRCAYCNAIVLFNVPADAEIVQPQRRCKKHPGPRIVKRINVFL